MNKLLGKKEVKKITITDSKRQRVKEKEQQIFDFNFLFYKSM